ncbi:hypothetical protein Pelo_17465 [Pelomyxa schiedti]|nr:hypothetical protein Pelo_17465 [Pelomyxa schiedti]
MSETQVRASWYIVVVLVVGVALHVVSPLSWCFLLVVVVDHSFPRPCEPDELIDACWFHRRDPFAKLWYQTICDAVYQL